MKKILIINVLIILFEQTPLFPQGGLLLDNTQIVCSGTIKIVIENGKWKNNGGTFTKGNSTVKLAGNASAANSVIEGEVTTFHDLEIAKSQNNVRLESNSVNVANNLIFTSKNLDMNGKALVLGSGLSAGNLSNETENARTYGAQPLSSVTKTRSISNPANFHFGNMGVRITATGSFGNTTVDRRHKAQTLPTGDGIQKYWRISTINNPGGQNATLRFQYFDAERNGINEPDLTIWRSTNNGVSWTDMGFATRSAVSNFVEQTALTDINGWWTLGAAPPFSGGGGERSAETAPEIPESTWSISPNPASQWIRVSVFSNEAKTMHLELLSADGKLVLTSQLQVLKGENSFRLDIGNLSQGIYFARVVGQSFQPIRLVK